MSTRSQGPAFFKHIIETVFGEPMDGELVKGLNHFGISTHLSLMTMSDASIERLEYPDASNNKVQLHDGHKQLVQIFQDYVAHYDVEPSDIINITSDLFDYFCIKHIVQILLSIATPHHLHHPHHHIQKVLLMIFVNL